ncbi:MAG: hypothetical protein OXH31_00750 [Gammaproteobacteria bacterium]|nr:hypothetical protein [Gammaproteobacteria bacterium]
MTKKLTEVKGKVIEIVQRIGSEKAWNLKELSSQVGENEVLIVHALFELSSEHKITCYEHLVSPDSYYTKGFYEQSYWHMSLLGEAMDEVENSDANEADVIQLPSLTTFLNDPNVVDDIGYFEKALVHREHSWSAYVNPREPRHHKIHFHVRCTDGANYSLDLYGQSLGFNLLKPNLRRRVIRWLESGGRQEVRDKWNEYHGRT